MRSVAPLLERLRDCVADDRDIEPALSFAAGGATRRGHDGLIEYLCGTESQSVFARVRFKHGRISRLDPGPQLQATTAQDALVERVRNDTAPVHGSLVVSRVLFSERPLNGVSIWNNTVRLSPCPPSAPIGSGFDWLGRVQSTFRDADHRGPPYPFTLEVRIDRSPNPFIEANRTLRQLDAYQYVITLLLTGHVRYAHWPSGRMWACLRRGDVPEYHLVSPGFSTNEDGRHDDFITRENGLAARYEGDDYYERLWGSETELLLPQSLESDISIFSTLAKDTKSAFLRACYWYALGIQHRTEPSLATVAFSTAIECLLPNPKRTPCKVCGQNTGPGPTRLFKQHLERYGKVIGALTSRRNALYDIRSALVHGSRADRVDMDFMSASRHDNDHLLLLEIVCQRSLRNWLIDPERDQWHTHTSSPSAAVR
jgi:hypothetical protein